MIMRKPVAADGPSIRQTAMKLAATMYPELIAEIDKCHWLVRDCTNNPDVHWSRVIGPEGEPRAVLLSRQENNLWAAKKHSAMILWYSEIPGAGVKLLREWKKWVKANEASITMAGFVADWQASDYGRCRDAMNIAERVGFNRRGDGGYMYFPRFDKCHS